jgi:hypothetical protein
MALAYSTICTVARTGTGPCARVAADAPPPTVEPQAAGAREEMDEFADASTERGARHACPSRTARVSAHRPPTRAAATPERGDVRGCPGRRLAARGAQAPRRQKERVRRGTCALARAVRIEPGHCARPVVRDELGHALHAADARGLAERGRVRSG